MRTLRYVCLFAVLLIDCLAVERENLRLTNVARATAAWFEPENEALGNILSTAGKMKMMILPDRKVCFTLPSADKK